MDRPLRTDSENVMESVAVLLWASVRVSDSANVTESAPVRVKASAVRASDSAKVTESVVLRVLPADAALDSENVTVSVPVRVLAATRVGDSAKVIVSLLVREKPSDALARLSENVTVSVTGRVSPRWLVRLSAKVIESTGSGREKLCAVRAGDSASVTPSLHALTRETVVVVSASATVTESVASPVKLPAVAASKPAQPCGSGWTSGPGPGRK
jgi:hypothetical protein